jgi:hypothetical protein
MGNISRANVFDVLKNKPRDRVVVVKGERRIVKRPEGRRVEQFVDLQGNVVWIQLLQLGTNHGDDAIDKKRMEMRRLGFVEYAKCPVKHGVRHSTPQIEQEFEELPDKMQRPCTDDPTIHEVKGKNVHVHDACAHIEWLIADRRRRAAEERDLRATKIETAQDLEKQKLAMQQQQLDESRDMNKRLIDLLEGKSKDKAK